VPRRATVFEIFIASPGDAKVERDIVSDVVDEWNAIHYRSLSDILHAVRWESHSHPQLGDRAQSIINKTLLKNADIVVAIFKGRLGQETGKHQSGTIEEIEEARAAGIPVLLYFYTERPSPPKISFFQILNTYDEQQEYRAALTDFEIVQRCRAHYERQGIVGGYRTIEEFTLLLRPQLYQAVSELISTKK
jgi:Domain of unknown function (DUF4062)